MSVVYLPTDCRTPSAGTVLQHCKRKAHLFRSSMGAAVCVFKIGFTSNPIQRFVSYRLANFSHMCLLHVTACKNTAAMLEAALIDVFWNISGCRNQNPGGEGPGHLQAPLFYVYMVGARADVAVPIGG